MILWLERLLWSGPLLAALLGSHIYFTCKLKFPQRHTLRGVRWSLDRRTGPEGVSGYGALATALAAAVGTGNIVGVATAVALGGPGAVLWCWLTGLLGMATRCAETALALRYRRAENGALSGGAMYVLEDGLHMPRAARLFAALGVLGAVATGALLQSNAIAGVLWSELRIPPLWAGLLTAALAAPAILGGAGAVARLCERLAPAMAGLYLLGCVLVLWANRTAIPAALALIVREALVPRAAAGGLAGSAVLTAARYGVARGLFTNEAGMGTAPMAAAAAPCERVARSSLAAMTAVFWDTVVICAMTGVTLVSAMVHAPETFAGAGAGELCALAFSAVPFGRQVLHISLAAFAFATVVGWCWYGERCWRYLTGGRYLALYRGLYLAGAALGALGGLETVWALGSVLSGLMALPNLYSLWRLRDQAAEPFDDAEEA